MTKLDQVVNDPRFKPYWGWHDDHRHLDRDPNYAPAIQQNREEFHELAHILAKRNLGGTCLQLGLGIPGAAHDVLKQIFSKVWTVDFSQHAIERYLGIGGEAGEIVFGDTHDPSTISGLKELGVDDLDFLFLDAGHLLPDIRADLQDYSPLVRVGGVIAMHDALKRPTYEEAIQVWRFVEELRAAGQDVSMIGNELGIAWTVKE